MERLSDGWHLEIVAFGGGGARADERVATVASFKELRQIPLRRDGWERREFGVSLDSKLGHEQLPVHITTLAYGLSHREDFIPDLSSADGVLVLACGDAAIDAPIMARVDEALSKRLGNPPRIVERAKAGESLKEPLRALVKSTVKALKSGELHEFWKESTARAKTAHDSDVYGPLTKEKILGQPAGEVAAFMLRVVRERGRRAAAAGRVPTSDAYERCLSARWQRFLAVNALEAVVADAGVAGLFVAPGARPMEREEVTTALAGLKRIGAVKKTEIIERALAVAREARLWDGAQDPLAAKVLEELSDRFYAVDDEPLSARLEQDIRKAPDDFTLGAYED